MCKKKYAFISVADKKGCGEAAKILRDNGYRLVVDSSTATILPGSDIEVISDSQFASIGGMFNRGGARPDAGVPVENYDLNVKQAPQNNNIDKPVDKTAEKSDKVIIFDIIIINLFPDDRRDSQNGGKLANISDNPDARIGIEHINDIDTSRIALLREAAKNYQTTITICNSEDLKLLKPDNQKKIIDITIDKRLNLAVKAFAHCASYDHAIANFLADKESDMPQLLNITVQKKLSLRYGENSQQKAALYCIPNSGQNGIASIRQLQGHALTYTNLINIDTAAALAKEFEPHRACVIIINQDTPYAAAVGDNCFEAYKKCIVAEPISSYGSMAALNRQVDITMAVELSKTFFSVIVAPSFTSQARAIFANKKRLKLVTVNFDEYVTEQLHFRSLFGGMLVQQRDSAKYQLHSGMTVTNRTVNPYELDQLSFAVKVCKYAKTNSIVYARDWATAGIGTGQTSRIDAVNFGQQKSFVPLTGAVCASEGIMAFRDSIDLLARFGVTALAQPGGSKNDRQIIEACNQHHIAMLFSGYRHFRH